MNYVQGLSSSVQVVLSLWSEVWPIKKKKKKKKKKPCDLGRERLEQ